MNEEQAKQDNLLSTTDCLEAVGVFRGWKNFFFVIALLCLLVLQVCFLLVDRGFIEPSDEVWGDACVTAGKTKKMVCFVKTSGQVVDIKEAAGEVAAEPNKPVEEPKQQAGFPYGVTFKHLFWTILIVNGLLILTAVLYCLTMLFSLKISLVGRLGGISHISRAFFLSLIMVVLILLGQISLGYIPGVIYTPDELSSWHNTGTDIFIAALYYLRFSGYGLLALLLLLFSQIRSSRWAKTVLRRLEVI
jgi:hypothetical protein